MAEPLCCINTQLGGISRPWRIKMRGNQQNYQYQDQYQYQQAQNGQVEQTLNNNGRHNEGAQNQHHGVEESLSRLRTRRRGFRAEGGLTMRHHAVMHLGKGHGVQLLSDGVSFRLVLILEA